MNSEKMKDFIVSKTTLLVESMKKIDNNANGVLFIVDEEGLLCGAVSDGDIRRWLLKTGQLDAEISLMMNTNPKYLYKHEEKNACKFMSNNYISAIPIVDEKKHIIDIRLKKEMRHKKKNLSSSLKDVPVIIMAGGKGTRLYPFTKILPKPLIPIGNIPIVERIIESFYNHGVQEFFMTVNYRKNMIKSYFSDIEKKYTLYYVEETEPLGTAGSIKLIDTEFTFPVFVTNCDILIRADYGEIYKYHKDVSNDITIISALKNDVIPYGVLRSKENGEIYEIEEKPQRSYFINTGMYIINPTVIDLIPKNEFFHMTDLTDLAIEKGLKVGMYPVSEDSFLDMGEFEQMKRMEEKLNLND